ncbi:hypothetical protein RE628_20350 [Paenibacillus sp. D2_2]|uniref:hypothetical protein n=1 Tax=Paenibacillus sp. D2_2 TaxID=3073092 RepID=UPI002815D2E0|nr:hypothetical protein [Paenibacillus sp. D2_2]WMT39723.1 hypothetical protein RE628_20350 [Paenibacillus sp. D2_2]
MIKDEINRILENLPEEELNKVYWYVEGIQKKYLFQMNLTKKGIIISELFEESQDIINLWDRTFAKNISEEEKSLFIIINTGGIFSVMKNKSVQ